MKVLFFAPHSAIWTHAFPEALVAEAAMQHGHEIVYVGCGGLLSRHCVSMSGCGVAFTASDRNKQAVCRLCKGNRAIITDSFGFHGVDLIDQARDEDRSSAKEWVSRTTRDNYLDLVVNDVEVGRLALYELAIQNKKFTTSFNDGEWSRYQSNLQNAIIVLLVMQRLLDEIRPDRVVLYNSLYSVNRVVCALCELRSIPQYFLHAGESLARRLSTLIVARGHAFEFYEHLRSMWPVFKHRPSSPQAMQHATDHFLEVIRGRSLWAYSTKPRAGADLRSRFRIGLDQKVICATMSSEDERRAAEMVGVIPSALPSLFSSQVDWLQTMIDYVRGRPDLLLIIRVHPREFPNKRDAIVSEHAKALQVLLASLPENVRVNWPGDDVSLYDLANITDVFVNAWSSAGKEMSWLGIPVVLYSAALTIYPPDLNYLGTSNSDYFAKIERALTEGWDARRIRTVYRWCAIEYEYACFDISQSFARNEYDSVWLRGIRRAVSVVSPYRRQRADCMRRAPSLACGDQMTQILERELDTGVDLLASGSTVEQVESTALRREVKRLVAALYGPKKGASSGALEERLRAFVTDPATQY